MIINTMKKLTTLLLTALLLATPLLAQEMEEEETGSTRKGDVGTNLLKNSDMSLGVWGWVGDRAFIKDEDNSVLAVRAKSGSERVFSQEFLAHRATDLEVTFKYKTADYKGRGLRISMVHGNSSWYNDMDLKTDNEWHEVKWNFRDAKDKSKLILRFAIKEGEGTVFFDDIVATLTAKK